jgi:ubiquitin carboxyl-terminal hydrolase 10
LTDLATGPAFEPANVYRMLQVIEANKSFKLGKQEDAEEFLSCILDGLHEEMSTLIKFAKGTLSDSIAANGSLMEDVSVEESSDNEDSWEQVGPKKKSVLTQRANFEKTPLAEIFVGYTRSALYKASSKDSATLQPFFTLQLDIQSDKVHSVKEALEGLVSRESVSGFTCSKTKAEVDVVRHVTLEELPPVLILHLKFFVYDKDGGSQKLLKNLEYGIDLEITKDLLSPNVRNKLQLHQGSYKLFAVVYHHGKKATGGHYTTAVFHPAINNWITMDDSLVKHVSVRTVLKNIPGRVPYLLYYRRVDMH